MLAWRFGIRRTILIVIISLLLAVPALAVAADVYHHQGRAYRGVDLRGTELGGLTEAQVAEVLADWSEDRHASPLEVRHGETSVELVPRDAGLTVDAEATRAAVMDVGHEGGWRERARERLGALLHGVTVEPIFRVDEQRFQLEADTLALAFEELPKDARLLLTEDGPRASASEEGLSLRRDALQESLLAALGQGMTSIEAPLEVLEPRVTTETARAAMEAAKVAFSRPLVLRFQDLSFELSGEQLATMAGVPEGEGEPTALTFDTEKGRQVLEELLAPVRKPAVDAKLRPVRGEKNLDVTPSKSGVEIDWDSLFRDLGRLATNPNAGYVPVPTLRSEPKVSTTDALALGMRREVSSFTTYFNASSTARAGNIRQVAKLLDGTIVHPGETFSFNESVGPRTKAAGFDEAPVIVGGVLTPGVGGGICQVSTTLFNAVFFAGLPVVERKPHSFYIDHYPLGRDATVSYGTVDFKFRNDSDRPLLISAQAAENSVEITLAASSWERTVEYETAAKERLRPPQTTSSSPRRLRDPSLASGEQVLEEGVPGRETTVTRVVKDADGQVLLRDEFPSVYAPKDYVLRVG